MIYIGVLALGLLVLLWDKTSREPEAADAQPVLAEHQPSLRLGRDEPSETPTTAASTTSVAVIEESPQNQLSASNKSPLAHPMVQKIFALLNTDKVAPSVYTRDLFVESQEFLAALSRHDEEDPRQKLIDLAGQLQLSGILIDSRYRCALINDQVLFVGDYIGPYRLQAVYPDSVCLQVKDEQITLSFPK